MTSALICCAPRSGAAWLVELLRRLGLPATHEVLFRPEKPRPKAMPPGWIEASWLATPFVRETEADVKLCLVRNPLHVVRSIMRIQLFGRPLDPFVHFARTYTDCWQDRDPLGNTCAMLERWREMATSLPFVRAEDLRSPCAVKGLLETLDVRPQPQFILRTIGEMPDRLNQRGDSSADSIGWSDLTPGVIEIAERLGYL